MEEIYSLDKFNPFEDLELSEAEIRSFYSNCKKFSDKYLRNYLKPLLLGYNTLIQKNYPYWTDFFRIALSKVIPSIPQPQAFIIYKEKHNMEDFNSYKLLSIAHDDITIQIIDEKKSFQKITSHIIILSTQSFLTLLKTHPMFKYVKICVFCGEVDLDLRQLHEMLYQLPQNIQRCLFVEKLSCREIEIAFNYLKSPIISIEGKGELRLEHLKEYYLLIEDPEWRPLYLAELLDELYLYSESLIYQGIIYANKVDFDVIINLLIEKGYGYFSIESSMNYFDCVRVIQKFLEASIGILVSNKPITYYSKYIGQKIIINYSFPLTPEEYLQRTGNWRGYSRGTCVSLTDVNELTRLHKVENLYYTKITEITEDITSIFY